MSGLCTTSEMRGIYLSKDIERKRIREVMFAQGFGCVPTSLHHGH